MKAVKNHWEMIKVSLYPALTGSKPPTLKFSESKEVRWGNQLPVKARLVRANNQWGMNKTPTDESFTLYIPHLSDTLNNIRV
ncbi:hypothetical protein [Bacillus mycoides]|uniref:hypothetical protein n=1 Tax=Bacillus mycoides TaxID=1405 RepID=UPI003D652CA4